MNMGTYREPGGLPGGHRLSLEDRGRLTVTGVTDVDRFDEEAAVLETAGGRRCLRGAELHLDRLDLAAGEVAVSGRIDSLVYDAGGADRESFLGRLFK